jgi:SAM-dependent methyltransferase
MTATWDELHRQERHQLRYPSEHVVRFLANLGGGEKKTALDIGCGSGRHTRLLMEFDYDVVAFDSSPSAQADVVGDMTDLDFSDNVFDTALAYGVFYYGTRNEGDQAIREMHRVLRPGGHGFAVVRSRRDWRARGIPEGEPERGMVMHFLAEKDIQVAYGAFRHVAWEVADWTTHNCTRLNSDWLIEVIK